MLQAEGIIAIAAVRRATARLDVGGRPRLRTDGTQERRRMEGAGAHFHVVGLHDNTAAFGPVLLQLENQVLEAQVARRRCGAHSGVLAGFKGAQYNGFSTAGDPL